MSGTVGQRSRKQWQIQDGPRGTLRRLRNQLAEDGCVESQVVIAKHLLDEARDSGDWAANTAEAVRWLTRAAEYGNEEAAALLGSCFESGTGITEENYEGVKACLSMSREEKAFRQAARGLFSALTPLGQEFVTTGQLKARLSGASEDPGQGTSQAGTSGEDGAASRDQADSAFSKWYEDTGIFDGQHLTEDRLAEIAARVSKGHLPRESLDTNESASASRPSEVLAKRAYAALRRGWASSSSKALDWTARYGDRFLLSLLPWSQLRTFALLLFCTLLPPESLLYVLPLAAFYASLAVMLVSTLQVLRNRRRFDTFVQWLRIFGSSGCDLHADHAEARFCGRRLRPYVRFFASLLVLLAAYPSCGSEAVPHSELAPLFLALSLACLFCFNAPSRHTWAFSAAACLLTAARAVHARGATDLLPRFLLLEAKLDLSDRLAVRLSASSLTAVALLACSLRMAAAESWRGSHKLLLPNLVALTWMQLVVAVAPQVTPGGVLRGAFLWTGVLALPAALVVAAAFAAFYSLSWTADFLRGTADPLRLLTTLACLLVAAAGKWFVDRRERLGGRVWKKVLTFVQLACGLFAVLQLLPASGILELESSPEPAAVVIDWHTYHGLCHTPAWNELTAAVVQRRCGHLAGAPVRWDGQVKAVKIARTQNRLEELLGFLPASVGRRLRCVYGDPYEECDREAMAEHEFRLCSLAKLAGRRRECHVRQWDRHEFEVSIQMSGGYWNSADVVLLADDSFQDFFFRLNAGDEVRFAGLLHANVGGLQPKVRLREVSCNNCVHDMGPAVGRRKIDLRDEFRTVCAFVFDFFFYPFVELKQRGDST